MNSPHLRSEKGFTLIELLIVMIIIGILMAVAIPAFLSQKQKAIISEAQQNASLVQKSVEACAASDTFGRTTNCVTTAAITDAEPVLGGAEYSGRWTVAAGGVNGYTVTGTTKDLGGGQTMVFTITKDDATGEVTKTCVAWKNFCQGNIW